MRRLLAILAILGCGIPAMGQVPALASRRRELTPLQYSFGPFTPLSPFNNAAGYTTVPSINMLQPSTLLSDNNQCAAATDFTQSSAGTGSVSFTATGGTCTVTVTNQKDFVATSNASSAVIPQGFWAIRVTQNGTNTTGSYDIIAVGIGTDTTHWVEAQIDKKGQLIRIGADVGSGATYFGSIGSFAAPTPPYILALSITGKYANMWLSTDGTTFVLKGSADISSKIATQTVGTLTGWKSHAAVYSNLSTSWKFSYLTEGILGATNLRDIRLVHWSDGRPYFVGNTFYFFATAIAGAANEASCELFSAQVSGATITSVTQLGALVDTDGTTYYPNDCAGDLIIDPVNGVQRLMLSSWGRATVLPYYGTINIGTQNLLGGGLLVISGLASMTLSGATSAVWDPSLVCDQWNYSASTCSHWFLAVERNNIDQKFYTSTSDPAVNSWSLAATDANANYEGSTVLRTATTTGSNGVSYAAAYSGLTANAARITRVLDTSASYLGALGTGQPSGTANPSWPQLFSFGNYEFWLTFDDSLFSNTAGTMGRLVYASTPKYSGTTNWPTLFDNDSEFSNTTSVTTKSSKNYTVAIGDLLIAMVRGGDSTTATVTVNDTLVNSWTCGTLNTLSTLGWDKLCYTFSTSAGTDSITGTANVSQQYFGLTTEQIKPGFLTTADGSISYSNNTATNVLTHTTGTFSTTAQGLVIVCMDPLFSGSVIQPDFIGPYVPRFGSGFVLSGTGPAICMGTVTPGAQTNITASATTQSGTAGKWGAGIIAFK